MKIFKLILLSLVFSFSAIAAEKKLYLFGGGGEPEGEKTTFDRALPYYGKFSNENGWQTTVSFNGGHAKTEKLMTNSFKHAKEVSQFKEADFNHYLDQIESDLKNNAVKENDQLMIIFETHGAKPREDLKTHSIALSGGSLNNYDTLDGADTANLDRLERIAQLAAEKNVKLAILDMSCFSGNTLKIANDKTCVLSATGEHEYSYKVSSRGDPKLYPWSFGDQLVLSLKKGKNLEDIFLQARAVGENIDFPMISTPEGELAQGEIYDLLNKYLNYNDNEAQNYYALYDQNNLANSICTQTLNHKKLLSEIERFKKIAKTANEKALYNNLIKSIQKYRNYQLKYEAALKGLKDVSSEVEGILNSNYKNQEKIWKGIDGLSFITADYNEELKKNEKYLSISTSKSSKEFWKDMIGDVKAKKIIADEINKKLSQSSKNKIKLEADMFAKSYVTEELASDVATKARKVYQSIYKLSKTKSSNPCRDFIL